MMQGRDPREALLQCVQDADAFYQEGRQRLVAGEQFTADEMDRHLQHLQRLTVLAKTAIDAWLVDAMTQRYDGFGEACAPLLIRLVSELVDAIESDPMRAQLLRQWAVDQLRAGLRAAEGDAADGWVPEPPSIVAGHRAHILGE
jgi:hypothetical protein